MHVTQTAKARRTEARRQKTEDRGQRTEDRGRKREDGAVIGHPSSVVRDPSFGRRVWLFRLAAIVLGPVLFLGTLELGLRAVGYGYNPHVAVKCEIDRQPCLGENAKFAWRFFPPILAREFEPFAFPVQKPTDTCRIFVLGSSAAISRTSAGLGLVRGRRRSSARWVSI